MHNEFVEGKLSDISIALTIKVGMSPWSACDWSEVITWPEYRPLIGCPQTWPRPLTICLVNHPRMHWADDFWHSIMAQFWRQCCMRAASPVLDRIQINVFSLLASSLRLSSFQPRVKACIIMSDRSGYWWNPSLNKPKFTDFTNSEIVESISTT